MSDLSLLTDEELVRNLESLRAVTENLTIEQGARDAAQAQMDLIDAECLQRNSDPATKRHITGAADLGPTPLWLQELRREKGRDLRPEEIETRRAEVARARNTPN